MIPVLLVSMGFAQVATADFATEARTLIQAKDWKALLPRAQAEVAQNPDSVIDLLFLGMALENLGRPTEADVPFAKARTLILAEMDVVSALAVAQAQAGNRPAVVAALRGLWAKQTSAVWQMLPSRIQPQRPDHLLKLVRQEEVARILASPAPTQVDFAEVKILRQPPAPFYPREAKEKRIQGTVVVLVTVDPSGIPIDARALEGPPELRRTAEAFSLEWKFQMPEAAPPDKPFRFKIVMPFRLR